VSRERLRENEASGVTETADKGEAEGETLVGQIDIGTDEAPNAACGALDWAEEKIGFA